MKTPLSAASFELCGPQVGSFPRQNTTWKKRSAGAGPRSTRFRMSSPIRLQPSTHRGEDALDQRRNRRGVLTNLTNHLRELLVKETKSLRSQRTWKKGCEPIGSGLGPIVTKKWISSAREQEISELAEHIANEYFPDDAIDPVAILDAKGISHSFGFYGDYFDGMLECESGDFHVYGNLVRLERSDSPRARFTLGHELGHYFIDEHRNALLAGGLRHPSRCNYESRLLIEREADQFASHLLLPESRLLRDGTREPKGLAGIRSIASKNGMSMTATAIRYVRADIFPCTVIKWDTNGFGWKWFSHSVRESGIRKTIENRSKLPPDSATEEAFSEAALPDSGFFSRGSTASTWFPYVARGSERDAIMLEEAIPLGRFGVLTFLYAADF